MSNLSAADFFKQATSNRPDRKKIFLEKYKKGEAFTLISKVNVVFKFEQPVYNKIAALIPGDNKGYAAIVLKDKNNKTYRMTQIEKTKEFGGGSTGSGAGAENTKLNESSVCLWCAVYTKYGKSDLSTVVSHQKDVTKLYIVDETDKNMLSQNDTLWLAHYQRVSAFLVDNLFSKGDYTFHRGSPFVDSINKKYGELNRKMEIPFANINKWSPADIWVVKNGFEAKFEKESKNFITLDDLNRYLLNCIKDNTIVGVSLKKTSNGVKNMYYNVGEKRSSMKFNGFRVMAPKGNIFSSKDVYVYATGEDDIDMQVRSFDDLSGYQGELIGKVAKYGKIAHGPMNMVLKDIGLNIMPNQQQIVSAARIKDEKLLKDLYKTFSKYADPGTTEQNFMLTAKSPDIKPDWVFSKYLGVKLIDILMTTTEKNRNEFVQGALGYALSNTKNSAPFIKVY